MRRESKIVGAARFCQRIPLHIFQIFEKPILHLFEGKQREPKSIFILGIPRGGSTLTYQTFCHGVKSIYLSNVWNFLYQLPLVGAFVSLIFSRNHRSNFKSEYGFVGGASGPAEGLKFWSWWMGVSLRELDFREQESNKKNSRIIYLKKVLSTVGSHKRPFITCFLGHTALASDLINEFPESIFVSLYRNPVSNALSVLKAAESYGEGWFSILPIECENFSDMNKYKRAAAQVYFLNKRLEAVEQHSNVFRLDYEKLCDDPQLELRKFLNWSKEKGYDLEVKFELPKEFGVRKRPSDNEPDIIRIKEELLLLERTYGKMATRYE